MAARVLFVLGVVCLVLGLFAGVANREVVDSKHFAAHVDSIRQDPAVARQVGLLVSDKIIAASPELVAIRPLVETVAVSGVSSPLGARAFRAATASIHQSFITGDPYVVLRLADLGAVTVAALHTVAPDIAARLPANMDVRLSQIGAFRFDGPVVTIARWVRILAWLLPIVGLLALIGAALLQPAPDGAGRRRRLAAVATTIGAGVLWLSGAVIAVIIAATVVTAFLPTDTLRGALAVAAWHEVDGRLWIIAAVAAVVGLAVRAGATMRPVESIDALWRNLLDTATRRPSTASAIAARAGVLILVGVLAVARPQTLVTLLAVVAGAVLVLLGVRELMHLTMRLMRTDRTRRRVARAARPVIAVVAVGALVAVIGILAWPRDSLTSIITAATADPTACNGHRELCERPYNEVAFPATHNSMSAQDGARWFIPEQSTGVMGQLDDGVRVFLVDSWYGQLSNRPPIVANTEESRAAAYDAATREYGTSAVDSALRVRDSLNLTPVGPVRPYLCHELCELGSTEWQPLMVQVRAWMVAHPREVITFFVQDQVRPSDVETMLRATGLYDMLYTPQPGKPWATLGEMIGSGHRLVWLHENVGGGTERPWLLDGNVWVQDTPYEFHTVDEFSCAHLRGAADAPLFLVNHWLSNFANRIRDAATVNREEVLFTRLEQCRAERGMIPNYVAVDNFRIGDLFSSVDRLNGVG